MSSIDQIDKNFAVETSLKEADIAFYDVRRDPFEVYGLYNYRTEPQFKRLPDEIGLNVNEGVSKLYLNTAGGRVRFSTDSQYVAIHAKMSSIGRMPHFAFSGSAGFDLFIDEFCIGNLQAIGDLPEGIDGRTGFALFDLAQHHFADTGKFRQFPQTQVAFRTQAFQVHGNDFI